MALLATPTHTNGNNPFARQPQVLPIAQELDLSDASLRDAFLESTNGIDDKIREAKRAEEKFKDRMAQVARDKLQMITKEKQLQLERKKRAMVFLNQMKR